MYPSPGAGGSPENFNHQAFSGHGFQAGTSAFTATRRHSPTELSAPSPARLTPSPHCSPEPSPEVQGLDIGTSTEARPLYPRLLQSQIGTYRHDRAFPASYPDSWDVAGGVSLINMSPDMDISDPRWGLNRRDPASGVTRPNLLQRLQIVTNKDGDDDPDRRSNLSGPSPFTREPSFDRVLHTATTVPGFWPIAFTNPPVEANVQRLGNDRFFASGPPRPGPSGRDTDGPFETLQMFNALPSVRETQEPRENRQIHVPPKHTQTSPTGGFLPMMAVAEPERRRYSLAAMQMNASDAAKFSTRYHGMHTDSNASADHLAPSQNCALWLTNLPADIDYSELLGAIRNVGRIWCTYINLPDNIKHHTAAAKVVFFTPEGAQKLLSESWTKTIVIRGHRVRASHNRIKYDKNAVVGKASRVLLITGTDSFVNPENLREWFKERFVFQEDRIIVLIKAGGRAVCEFRFGSYRCQAQMGKMALEKDRPEGLEKVEFGEDPCEVGENMASYGTAAERIQGKGL
ncbi:hypothetical protein HIM_07325 [Hirsutella minnesotensis 3608]|uniref:RRM domain-containing protein n=1 Tax=Hirsutella minnesotensis 3608 TaxID=1043627 RepID=A0A0F7ZI07_9HYPO|nr:hypothetical protein HIM_07325 [Hirsutella minnesotensis 3608]